MKTGLHHKEEIGVAIACITLFGLIAMVAYPFIFLFTGLGSLLDHSRAAFGVWAGTGIHETAQVVAAAAQVSKEAADLKSLSFQITNPGSRLNR